MSPTSSPSKKQKIDQGDSGTELVNVFEEAVKQGLLVSTSLRPVHKKMKGGKMGEKKRVVNDVSFEEDELVDIGSGDLVLKLVGGKNAGCEIGLLKETYPPGADTGSKMISFEGEEGGFVIKGQIEVTIGDQTKVLKSGQAYYFDTKIPHRFRNRSKRVCQIVSASTYHE